MRRPVTILPVAALARALPELVVLVSPAGQTAHVADAARRAACGRRPRRAEAVDTAVQEPPLLPVCRDCYATLTELTRSHLSALGRPTPAELAAVHDARIRAIASKAAADLEHVREDAIFDGSVSQPVTLVEATRNTRGDDAALGSITISGHTAVATTMTVGQLAGTLKPGAVTGGRRWITDAPDPGDAVHVPAGIDGTLVCAPPAPGRFPAAQPYRRAGAR